MGVVRLLLTAVAWVALWSGAAAQERSLAVGPREASRVALVIGNAAYPGVAALRNPANDATDVAAKLRRLGFSVALKTNVSQKEMLRALTDFGDKVQPGAEALFFYAGHGMQVRGRNYLIPVDAEIRTENAVSSEAVDVDQLLDKLAAARLSIVILDACRNNPFERRFRGSGQGLAQINAPTGTLIAYATAPGKVAADGEGRNGLYTSELLSAMDVSGIKIEDVFKRVRANVVRKSGDVQTPWESSSLTGDFYFVRGTAGAAANPPPQPIRLRTDAEIEQELWEGVREADTIEAVDEYLKAYPDGRYVAQARILAIKLRAPARNRREGGVPGAAAAPEDARAAEVFSDPLQDGSAGPEMVVVPAGKFLMGDVEGNADSYAKASVPVREVTFAKPFALSRFEITFEEFDRYSRATGREPIADNGWGRGRRPATKIVWEDAVAYVEWLSAQTGKRYRIPTEAEWEYAARAGTRTNFWWGNQPSHEYANYGKGQPGWFPSGVVEGRDQWEYTAPVGQFPPNPFGLYDMQGNVWEWVADCWHESYGGAPVDGSAFGGSACENRVMRGGSWGYNPNFMRASSRVKVFWGVLSFLYYGVRVARDID
jgi:formylglycine-generating enzyme required for sulfatase activity/uncharacterized caspase-like protein